VSGHAFLRRRLELALVTGDARMAQDPLRTQRRSVGVGVLIALLVAGGMAVLALLRPQPAIGDADLVADESGALHVRLDDVFHPVTNIASARLLLGTAAEVTGTTGDRLAGFPAGRRSGSRRPRGSSPRTTTLPQPGPCARPRSSPPTRCRTPAPRSSSQDPTTGSSSTDSGLRVPDAGPRVARALGATPVELPGDVADRMVRVLDRGPDVALPSGPSGLPGEFAEQGRLVTAGDRTFVVAGGGLAEVTGARRAVAEALAREAPVATDLTRVLSVPGSEVLTQVPVDLTVREIERPCVGGTLVDGGAEEVGGTAGGAAGGRYTGPRGTVALVTERGLVLVSESGIRYSVGSAEDLAALGVLEEDELPVSVPWRVIEPLPDGGELSVERARRTADVA
jgi:hypothetical protein